MQRLMRWRPAQFRRAGIGIAVGVVCSLALCGPVQAAPAVSDDAYAEEYHLIEEQIAGHNANGGASARLVRESLRQSALIADSDRDPIDVVRRRVQALVDDIRGMPNAPDLSAEVEELSRLARRKEEAASANPGQMNLFADVCRLRRRIAFSNPLLDFDGILFLKHDRARYEHMVDRYFGFHAVKGGGVCVLENPFGDRAGLRDVLAGARVENGRLRGTSLSDGSFISLELSFDAKTILLAWTEAEVPVTTTDRTPKADLWTPQSTYHVFKAGVDGSKRTATLWVKSLMSFTSLRLRRFTQRQLPNLG